MTMSDIDIKKLLKILPQLIRENDTVKGAIITALSGVIATRDDIRDLIREMDKHFDDIKKGSWRVNSPQTASLFSFNTRSSSSAK